VSDQDFFFDEDDKSAKSAGKDTTKKASSPAPRSAAPAPAQTVTMTVAILIGVIGILLGAVIGLFVGKSMAVPAVVLPGAGGTTTQQAPQLTPEQLQGGELPAGHPAVGGGAGGAATGTPAP
jgi:hypothetical protein